MIMYNITSMDSACPPLNRKNIAELLLIAAFGSFISMLFSGFVFGIDNNVYHLAIASELYDKQQYANDVFIQSLRYFASGVWIVLAGTDRYVDAHWIFFVLFCLSRIVAFIGFLACAEQLGVRTLRQRIIFAVLIASISIMRGYSYAGGGDLFANFFSHSGIADGLILLAIAAAARGWIAISLGINGTLFFCNAFIGVWNFVPLAMITTLLLIRKQISWQQVLLRGALGGVLFFGISVPVVVNILANPEWGAALDFDYRTFLEEYYPCHTLIWSVSALDGVGLFLVAVTGWLAFRRMDRAGEAFEAALWGFILVYAIGIVVPYLTNSSNVLNLHLLRSGTGIHLLAALASASVMTRWITSAQWGESKVLAPLLVLSLCTLQSIYAYVFGIAVLVASRNVALRRFPGWVRFDYGVCVMVLVVWPWLIWRTANENLAAWQQVEAWQALGAWARVSTGADSIFLIPTLGLRNPQTRMQDAPYGWPNGESGAGVFEYVSQRRVWVDWKRGAAVMWLPSYYATWRPRMAEVGELKDLAARLTYAKKNGIDFVVDSCAAAGASIPRFKSEVWCVFSVDGSPNTSGHALFRLGISGGTDSAMP